LNGCGSALAKDYAFLLLRDEREKPLAFLEYVPGDRGEADRSGCSARGRRAGHWFVFYYGLWGGGRPPAEIFWFRTF